MRNHTLFVQAPVTSMPAKTEFAWYPSVDAAGADWATLSQRAQDIFFQRPFLHTVELNPPLGLRLGYLMMYKDGQPVGMAVCQIKHFSASESLAENAETDKSPCVFTGISNWLKKRVSGWVEADILICGNLLITGAHGYWFDRELVEENEMTNLLQRGLSYAAQQSERLGVKIAMILVKDVLPEERATIGQKLIKDQYTEFEIQPNMVLHLPYRDFEAYLGAMSTKYRTRAKRAFKKGEVIERRELTTTDVQQEAGKMYQLYREVATNAGFNMVDLNEHYMSALHQAMNGQFRVFGYYLNGEMVSYCTTLLNHQELEAHFLGYNKEFNHEYQVYLNMLYDMIRVAFDSGCNKVVFARTALEIKSSVGAEPEQLLCYLCHQNGIINKFTSTVLDYLKPTEEWQQRHPFKD